MTKKEKQTILEAFVFLAECIDALEWQGRYNKSRLIRDFVTRKEAIIKILER
jgi:hypothetical protein